MAPMLDWLRRDPNAPPSVDLGDRTLPVAIRRLAHARRITLRLAPDGSEARVSMPRWGRTQDALDFARSRADWLAAQIAALPARQEVGHGSTIAFRGQMLAIVHMPSARRRPELIGQSLRIGGPVETLAPRLRRWLEAEARTLLAEDLAHYCARAGRAPAKLSLSNAQRRWGSCGPQGSIRINWRLVMAPDFVRRSVVAHEVAHLDHFDHSPRFHARLSELFEGDVAEANRWLRREGRKLYAACG